MIFLEVFKMDSHKTESYGKALKYLLIIPGAFLFDIVVSVLIMPLLDSTATALAFLFLIFATIVAFFFAIIRTIIAFVKVSKNNDLASNEYHEKKIQEQRESKLPGADINMLYDTDYDFSATDLSNKDFANAELNGDKYDFSNSNLRSACFRNVVISGADFDGADLTGVSFEGAKINNATFRGSIIESVNFRGASLDNVIFDNVVIRNCETREMRITNSRFTQIDAAGLYTGILILIKDSTFKDSNLRNASLIGIRLSNVTFDRTDLEEANLRGTKLSQCAFNNSKMNHVFFEKAEMINSRFDRTRMSQALLDEAKIIECGFDNCELPKAHFVKSILVDVEFVDCDMKNIIANKASFGNVRTDRSNLNGASLKKAGYEKCDKYLVDQIKKSNYLA